MISSYNLYFLYISSKIALVADPTIPTTTNESPITAVAAPSKQK